MKTRLALIDQARALIRARRFDDATLLFERIGPANSDMWWLQLEQARAKRHGHLCRDGTAEFRLFFSPCYRANQYQPLLHTALVREGVFVEAIDASALEGVPEKVLVDDLPFVFHQHWLREIYRGLRPDKAGFDAVDRYFGTLRLLRSLGGKVLWTVHNLFDHDLSPDELQLNVYCLRQMAKVADRILIHTADAIPLLEETCRLALGDKCCVLHHPLYDSIAAMPECPPEMRGITPRSGTKFLCFGFLRPYKGGMELLSHYLSGVRSGRLVDTRLIFAGVVQDMPLLRAYDSLDQADRRDVVLINRRVSDSELAWLCQHADVAVLPYRNILTSGSFYQATTYALPTIVPASGMFVSAVEDGINGLCYANESDLGETLIRGNMLGKAGLRAMGKIALERCRDESASAHFADRYKALLHRVLQGDKVGGCA